MFLHTAFRHDARVEKEAATLVEAGHQVRVIALREPGTEASEERDGFRTVRVDADPAPTRLLRRLLERSGDDRAAGLVLAERAQSVKGSSGAGPLARAGAGALDLLLRANLLLAQLKYVRRSVAEAGAEPADVWIAHDLDALPSAHRARARFGGCLVYDSHELFVERDTFPPQTRIGRALWRAVEASLIRAADHVVTVSDSIAALLRDRYGIPRPTVIMNVPSAGSPATPQASSPLRSRLGIPPDRRVALYLGGIHEHRPLDHLVESAAHLGDEAMLVLMGPADPGYLAKLRTRASELGVGDRIRFAGPVDLAEVLTWAAGADVGIVPFRGLSLNQRYSLPNKLFDYLSAGLPVVASELPDMARIVTEYGVGETFDPDDPTDLAAAIRRVLSDADRYEELRRNAGEAAKVLTWSSEASKLLRIVEECAPTRSRRPA
jgi:glycosyltransferase involved in cell wall biosynthesis